jgi:hypothetical protein
MAVKDAHGVKLPPGTKVFLLLFFQKKKNLLLSYEKEAKRPFFSWRSFKGGGR